MRKKNSQDTVTISGVLVPNKWRNDGTIIGFALLTNDEKKYILHHPSSKAAFMPVLRKNIRVSGFTGDKEENEIIVTEFQPFSPHIDEIE